MPKAKRDLVDLTDGLTAETDRVIERDRLWSTRAEFVRDATRRYIAERDTIAAAKYRSHKDKLMGQAVKKVDTE